MELDCSPNCLSKLSGGSCVSLITWISRVTILKLKKTLQRFATYKCVPALTGKSSSRSRNMAIDNPGRDVCRTTDTISIRLHIYWHFLASMRNRILLTDSFFRTLTVKPSLHSSLYRPDHLPILPLTHGNFVVTHISPTVSKKLNPPLQSVQL